LKIPYLSRPRLLHRLNGDEPLVYLCSPVGSGKTALLNEWRSVQKTPIYWLTCSEADNDPACLWQRLAYLIGIKADAELLTSRVFPSSIESALAALCHWIERQPSRAHLILDDYQILQSGEARAMVRCLLQMQPGNLRVFIASQTRDESLPLSRWVLSGRALEITAAELAFTAEEVRTIYGTADAQALYAQTGGWVAAVHLAFTAGTAPKHLISEVCASIFATLAPEVQSLLVAVSRVCLQTINTGQWKPARRSPDRSLRACHSEWRRHESVSTDRKSVRCGYVPGTQPRYGDGRVSGCVYGG